MMNKIKIIILLLVLIFTITSCQLKHTHIYENGICECGEEEPKQEEIIKLNELFPNNFAIAKSHFQKFNLGDELKIVDKDSANQIEMIQFQSFFDIGIIRIAYVDSNNSLIPYYPIAWEYESNFKATVGFERYYNDNTGLYVYKNLVLTKDYTSYLLVEGQYDQYDNYALSMDKTILIFDISYSTRKQIRIPDGVKEILSRAFILDNATSLICNEQLEEIGDDCFGVSNLRFAKLNDGLKKIGDNAFNFTNLEYIVIPDTVTYIGKKAFADTNIYCEAKTKPKNWDLNFAVNCNIYWGDSWEIDPETNKPKLIS